MSLKDWWYTLIKEEWVLRFSVPSLESEVLPDGTRIEHKIPKEFHVKKFITVKPNCFIFIDTDDHKHEIRLTSPISYSIEKIY